MINRRPLHPWIDYLKSWFHSPPKTQEALIDLLRHCHQQHLINTDTLSMLEGVLEFDLMRVRDILLPKNQMVSIAQHASLSEIISIVTDSGHSRFPVTGEDSDEIIGILHAKDLLRFQANPQLSFELYDLLRQATFVPESKRLVTLLSEFRKSRNHMAIVVDEYGAVSGLITLEDIIEQIIGDIADEFDVDEETLIRSHGENRYTIKGHTPIELFNEQLQASISDEAYDTIAGIITGACGHLPKRGETVLLHGFQFKILHTDARRIRVLECIDKRPPEAKTS